MELNQEFAKKFPLKILVAEDNLLNQKLVQKMLQKLGYEPDIVDNGEEALNAVKTSVYQLLLMDLQMPIMDGLEAARLIFEQVDAANRPTIVALTAAVSSDVKEKCLAAGMEHFITKPIGIQKLADLLQECY